MWHAFEEGTMVTFKWLPILLVSVWFIYAVYGALLNKKVSQLREKYDYIAKKNTNSSATRTEFKRRRSLLTPGLIKENNTKREYVYYPDEGHNGHFQGGDAYRYFNGGMNAGCECEEDDDGCGCGGEPGIPEFTHTHHVVRYHHHVGKSQ